MKAMATMYLNAAIFYVWKLVNYLSVTEKTIDSSAFFVSVFGIT